VAIGGGHGLAASLRAARRYAAAVTGVVSVADDGGSSGRLRQTMGIPPPGDLRRCLAALSDNPLWATALEHRFDAGELSGHALGNLLIAGLADVLGDFQSALDEVACLVGARGRVLPATIDPVVLKAEVERPAGGAGTEVEGQVAVQNSSRITRVSVLPDNPRVPPAAVEAIRTADQVVIGPGSLYTSVLAAVVVPAIRVALSTTTAQRVYVCNLGPQVPETEGYSVASHVEALRRHDVDIDVVLRHPGALPAGQLTVESVERDVARDNGLAHDPEKLARALAELAR
jgi:uncharacterized cofD-like protein